MSATPTLAPSRSTPAGSPTESRVIWSHKDSAPAQSMEVALALRGWERWPADPALAGAVQALGGTGGGPMTTADRVRMLRAQAIATAYAVENATKQRVPPQGEMETQVVLGRPIREDMFSDRAHAYAAATVARTWQVLAGPGRHVAQTATTLDGQPPVLSPPELAFGEDTSGGRDLLLGFVALVALTGFTVAACYNGQTIGEVIDRKLTEDALTKRMMAGSGGVIALLEEHSKREIAAGHALPFSSQEQSGLDAHNAAVTAIAKREQRDLPNPFMRAAAAANDAAKRAAEGFGGALGLGVLGLGVYALTR
jgi:hypothetical protein